MNDKELFEFWENKIKPELTVEIVSNKKGIWSLTHNFGHKIAGKFLKEFNCNGNKLIVEIGCGQCNFVGYLKNIKPWNYLGIDISKKMLDLAKPGISRIQSDIYTLPFLNNRVDVVVSIYSLEHLHELERGLDEVHRILNDNGIFIFAIPMEGGCLYNLGRRLTSKKMVERKYHVDYLKIIREYEHPNSVFKILTSITKKFKMLQKRYYPLFIPSANINLFAIYKVKKR